MNKLEMCINCDCPTDKAGEGDDSLYINGHGPLCDVCYDEQMPPPINYPADNTPMICGHPETSIVGDVTKFCGDCAKEAE